MILEAQICKPLSDKEMLSPHFHSVVKGCKIVKRLYKGRSDKYPPIIGGYCRTHGKELERGGWEWSWWGGQYYKPVHPNLYPALKRKKYDKEM